MEARSSESQQKRIERAMTMELKNPRYFRSLMEGKDPAGTSRGHGDGSERNADAGGPDEGSRVPGRLPTYEEIFFFDAEP
jgi:hypothetical protein